jgi:hypothetical protein
VYTNIAAPPLTSIIALCTLPLIFKLFDNRVILFVPAVPVASKISIASPTAGDAGNVRDLADVVVTKYLYPDTSV